MKWSSNYSLFLSILLLCFLWWSVALRVGEAWRAKTTLNWNYSIRSACQRSLSAFIFQWHQVRWIYVVFGVRFHSFIRQRTECEWGQARPDDLRRPKEASGDNNKRQKAQTAHMRILLYTTLADDVPPSTHAKNCCVDRARGYNYKHPSISLSLSLSSAIRGDWRWCEWMTPTCVYDLTSKTLCFRSFFRSPLACCLFIQELNLVRIALNLAIVSLFFCTFFVQFSYHEFLIFNSTNGNYSK